VDIGNDTVLCQSVNLSLDAGTSGNIYLWSGGATTQTIVASSIGTYWVEVSNGNCDASDTIEIQQIILDPFIGNDTSLCDGQTVLLDATEPGATYLWSTGSTSSTITVSLGGQYWVQTRVGPCTESDTINVTYIPYPVSNLPSGIIICPDDSVLLDAGGPATEYLWSTSDTTQTISVSNSGIYSVTISNFQCVITDSVNAQQVTFPVLDNDTSLCAGQPISLNVFYPGANYLWSTTATTPAITVTTAGLYWVVVSFAGCNEPDTINVNYLSYPIINLVPNTLICPDDSVFLDGGGPATDYLWSTGETTQSIYATSTGTYIVTASNEQCSTTDTAEVVQAQFIPLAMDTTLCAGQTVTLNAATPGATYLWSTTESTSSITVSSSGQYWVITTVGPCQHKDTSTIAYVQYPVVSLPPVIDMCPGDSATLNAGNSASTYLWSGGQQTQSINVGTGGVYSVTASNLHCSVTDTTIVNAPLPLSWSSTTTLCNVERYVLEAGIPANSYFWSTGETSPSIEVMEAGTYWVVANTDNCIISDTMVIKGGLGTGVLWFPNSFTPNENGLNDKFEAKGADITFFHLMIFDRWGELIYETEKLDEGWDGFYKGKLSQQDVYVWKVKYKTLCSEDEIHTRIGHVTLVR
jgi:gliding motility-associated-like protein